MQNSKRRQFLVALLAGTVMAVLIAWAKGLFTAGSAAEKVLSLCDGFSVSGLLLLSLAFLSFVAGEGLFNVLSYAVQKSLHHFIPGRGNENLGSYYDYLMAKGEKEKPSLLGMFLAGAACFVLGLILMGVWYGMQ